MTFQYILAPLEDITDNVFRSLCHKHGADLTFTEMVRMDGLARGNAATWSRLSFKDETPTAIQLIGSNTQRLKKFLSEFKPSAGFKGFNLNLGCPSPSMIKIGQGCAMIKRIAKTRELVEVIKQKGYSVSIKLRLGMNHFEKEKKVYLNLIKAVNADFFVVHCRHGGQTYADGADYSVLAECVATGKKIIANGDIDSKEKVELLKKIGVSGVMIGRAAVNNPGIFAELKGLNVPGIDEIKQEYEEFFKRFNPNTFRYRKNFFKFIGSNERFRNSII